jgi:spermidine synthase
LHDTLFAGLGATTPAPKQSAILRDGELAGTIYEIESAEDAPILDHTPASFPYRLIEKPRVLLLGESGSVNIWLAKRFGASKISVVQSDPVLVGLLKGPLSEISGGIFSDADVIMIVEEPRAYLEGTDEKFDIIQIVTAEGLAAGTSGLQSLHEDFLLTTEGMALAWRHLNPRGMLAITRGIQTPPRDSLKLFATLQSALESQDVPDPDQHLALVRNYLAATILAFRNPVTEELSEPIRAAVDTLSLDVEWLPLFPPGSFKTRSVIAGPEGGSESYIGHGIKNILGTGREIFTDEWMYNIRPANDDSPYFYNFFRWESIGWLRDTYGPLWFRRLELGYMILVFVLIEAIVVGAALILLPLLGLRAAKGHAKSKLPTFLYFLFIGLGFMTLEMISILRFTKHLGEPLYATSLMIACYLLAAGTGSALSGRLSPDPRRGIVIATACILVLGGLHIVTVDPIMTHFAGWPTAAKAILAIVLTLPLGFFMGWMFPCGLRIIGETAGSLVPWAWAVNGFASVAAPPLALMLSMSHGFRFALIIALACYTLAGIASRRLPRR